MLNSSSHGSERRSYVFVADLRLKEQLIALRHLRPGYQSGRPRSPLARGLFRELLNLDDEVEPLNWLESQRGQMAALVATDMALDAIAAMEGGYRNGSSAGPELRRVLHHRYGELLGNLSQRPTRLERATLVPDELTHEGQILNDLARLRDESGLSRQEAPRYSLTDPSLETLLADLLLLPDAVEPIIWLEEHRAAQCARLALAGLLRAALPAQNLSTLVLGGTLRRPLTPRMHLRAGTLDAWVDRIDFFAAGFAIHLRVRFHRPHALPPGVVALWEGFARVTDSDGYRYIAQPADLEASTWFGKRWRQRLTLACWPPLGGARELNLEAEAAALSVSRPASAGGALIPEPSDNLGSIKCSVRLASQG